MNIIFINYYDFRSPSGMHIFHLANALTKLGARCAVYSAGDAGTASRYGKAKFLSYDIHTHPSRMLADCGFKEEETLFHCWTPRECVRTMTETFLENFKVPVVVHMEDNEDAITEATLKTIAHRAKDGESPLDLIQPTAAFAHPGRYPGFLASAAGYTCIIEELLDFKPEGVPGLVFWPSCEPAVFKIPQESSPEEKMRWGVKPNEYVVFYPGNMHSNNQEEVVHLYLAVAFLRKSGVPVRIIKFGAYPVSMQELVFAPFRLEDVVVDLTDRIEPSHIPTVMRAADFLVQPGEDNAFNRYRFPCKLPLFLASARPVILPPSNLGKHLAHGENCLLLQKGKSDPQEITGHLRFLIDNPATAREIGAKGRAFAKAHFSWDASAEKLRGFYAERLSVFASGPGK